MDIDRFETDERGRLIRCGHCGEHNESDEKDANFCIYCGYSLLNQCTNYNGCGAFVPAKAAFCPYCGSETHFLRSGLVESKRRREIQISDDDLPF